VVVVRVDVDRVMANCNGHSDSTGYETPRRRPEGLRERVRSWNINHLCSALPSDHLSSRFLPSFSMALKPCLTRHARLRRAGSAHPPKAAPYRINSLNASLHARSNLHCTIHQAVPMVIFTMPLFVRGSLNPSADISSTSMEVLDDARSTHPYSRLLAIQR